MVELLSKRFCCSLVARPLTCYSLSLPVLVFVSFLHRSFVPPGGVGLGMFAGAALGVKLKKAKSQRPTREAEDAPSGVESPKSYVF